MPATVVLSAIYGSISIATAALGAVGYAAATFAINLVFSYTISRIFAPKMPDLGAGTFGADGARVQLPPATDNRLPVSYGTAWLRPAITDAKISEDQKTMWYVLPYCETMDIPAGTFGGGNISFGTIKWGDKTLNFDAVDQTKVVSWTNDAGETDTRVDGKIYVYRYVDGSNAPQAGTPSSAITVLQDPQIAPANQWTATDLMSKTAFLIIKVLYDQEVGLTGLDQIAAQVINTLTRPGGCIYNYMLNERYGCGIPLAQIDVTSLQNLSLYSAQPIPYTTAGGAAATQDRYGINGPLDTASDCFTNLQMLADACDSWIQWNEANAQWGVVINRGYDQAAGTYPAQTIAQLFDINDNNIIGGIQLTPVDLNSTYNRVECSYPDENIYDQINQVFVDLPANQLNPNEPDNVLSMNLPLTNNSVTATYIATRKLIQSREDLIVALTMDFSGIQIDAGDVVRVNNSKFQWVDKLFRVTQVQEGKSEDGTLYAQLTLAEYNNQVYANIPITEYVPSPNTGVTDPNIANQPAAPILTGFVPQSPTGQFTINTVIPASGTYGAIEIYYSTTTDTLGEYTLLKTLLPTDSNTYNNGDTIPYVVDGLPSGNYFFRTRVVTMTGIKSPYSVASTGAGPGGSTTITGPIVNISAGAAVAQSVESFPAAYNWTGARTQLISIVTTGKPVKVWGTASVQYSIRDTTASNLFVGSITGTTLTITAVTSGIVVNGRNIVGDGVADNTTVVSQITPLLPGETLGGIGRYNVSIAQTVATTVLNIGYGVSPTSTYCQSALFQVRLLKDGVYLQTFSGTYATYVDFASINRHATTPVIPFAFRHTPPAGTHNYQMELYVSHYNQIGTNYSNSGEMYGTYYTLVEETTA